MNASKRIARVFPRRTSMTPTDELAFVDCPPPLLAMPEIDELHISVAFTWDMPKAERLAKEWSAVGVPIQMGGPAFNLPGDEFVPGLYVKEGATITSRGCPNHCWFCAVPKRERGLRELPIHDGWNILDDNILACSDEHVEAVFKMLERQPRAAEFTGGLEAKILKPWHAKRLREIHANRMYFAYDTADDYEPLVQAGKIMMQEGHSPLGHRMCCYVLIGYKGDTFEKAEKRLTDAMKAGFLPYAMLYRDEKGDRDQEWMKFQREWLRPAITTEGVGTLFDWPGVEEDIAVDEMMFPQSQLYPNTQYCGNGQELSVGFSINYYGEEIVPLCCEEGVFFIRGAYRDAAEKKEGYDRYYLARNAEGEPLVMLSDGLMAPAVIKPLPSKTAAEICNYLSRIGEMPARGWTSEEGKTEEAQLKGQINMDEMLEEKNDDGE